MTRDSGSTGSSGTGGAATSAGAGLPAPGPTGTVDGNRKDSMRPSSRPFQIALAVLVGALLAGGGYAIGAGGGTTIHGCVTSTHQLLIERRCGHGEARLVWNEQGPQGVRGQTGAQGPPAAAAWATVLPGVSGPIVLDSDNLNVEQDGDGVFTLTATASGCASGQDAEVVTPIATNVSTAGIPAAYVVKGGASPAVFEVVTGGIGTGGFVQGNVEFSVAVDCK